MLKKIIKATALTMIGAMSLASAPAMAGTVITYYAPNGWGSWGISGYDVYCDSGALYGEYGYKTEWYSTSWVSIPC